MNTRDIFVVSSLAMATLVVSAVLTHTQSDAVRAQPKNGGDPKDAYRDEEVPPAGKPQGMPRVMPEPTGWQFLANPGALSAATRFLRWIADPALKHTDVISLPFDMNGQALKDAGAVAAFEAKARQGAAEEKKSHHVVSVRLLPPGNSLAEARRWLGPPAEGRQFSVLHELAGKRKAWLVLLSIATFDREYTHSHALLAVTDVESEEKARVIGIVDYE